MVTFPASRMTGTLRRPFVRASISSRRARSFCTLWYWTSYCLSAKASRAAVVYGQESFPKMRTLGGISISSVGSASYPSGAKRIKRHAVVGRGDGAIESLSRSISRPRFRRESARETPLNRDWCAV